MTRAALEQRLPAPTSAGCCRASAADDGDHGTRRAPAARTRRRTGALVDRVR